MNHSKIVFALFAASMATAYAATPKPAEKRPTSFGEVIATSAPSDWRTVDPENTIYMELPGGRVIIELAPDMAPNHVANIKTLARENYYDGLAIVRSQDNFVAQWNDPDEKNPKAMKNGKHALDAEFTIKMKRGFAFNPIPDRDGYAPESGFHKGFPAGRNKKTGEAWLLHCYGMIGAGRDNANNSGSGAELYAVTGNAPRHLDRNVTVLGRVLKGMTLLSSLPRGVGPLGMFEKTEQNVPIKSIRVAADVPEAERTPLEVIRTDTPLFQRAVAGARNRGGEWYKVPAGYVEVCNVPLAVREKR